jgi:hypothetical protein
MIGKWFITSIGLVSATINMSSAQMRVQTSQTPLHYQTLQSQKAQNDEANRLSRLHDQEHAGEKPPEQAPMIRSVPGRGNTEQIIQDNCQSEWTDDFRMQAYCGKLQREAVQALSSGKPPDIPQDQFVVVRGKCVAEWQNDFRMRAYCEKLQFGAIRELRR